MEILIVLGIITVSVLLWNITPYSANDDRIDIAEQKTQPTGVHIDTQVSDHGLFGSAQPTMLVPSIQDRPLT
ncbi:MAG: hypothetical protein ACT4PN_16700 [Nitrospiraceae bacterium]